MPTPGKFNFSGTPDQLAILLPQAQLIHKFFEGLELDGGGGSNKPLPVDVVGKILVFINFKGVVTGTIKPHWVEKSFRLMKDDPRTISKTRLDFLGNRIASKFNNFSFSTGRQTYTYNVSTQGFTRSHSHFASQADALKVFEQLLDIDNLSPHWQRLTHSSVPIPGDRFQTPPEKIEQAGVLIRQDHERPTALMKFYKALIKFPHIRKPLKWVDENFKVHDVYQAILDYQAAQD